MRELHFRPSRWTAATVVALALLSSVGCGASAGSVTQPSTTAAAPTSSTSSTTSTTPADTSAAGGDTGTGSGDTGSDTGGDTDVGTDTGGTSAGTSLTACGLAKAADLRAAGVKGTIEEGERQSSGIQDDPTSSVCSFDVSRPDRDTNVLVQLAPEGGSDLFDILQDEGAATTSHLRGIGDEAIYSAEAPDPDQNGEFGQQVLVRRGTVVLLIRAPDSTLTGRSAIIALATTLAARLR